MIRRTFMGSIASLLVLPTLGLSSKFLPKEKTDSQRLMEDLEERIESYGYTVKYLRDVGSFISLRYLTEEEKYVLSSGNITFSFSVYTKNTYRDLGDLRDEEVGKRLGMIYYHDMPDILIGFPIERTPKRHSYMATF